MNRRPSKSRAYKDTTVQQLRSFHETARLGSFSAAASSLGLAAPTVWNQVRALELDVGQRLLESNGRRCHLTEAGRLLADLAGPLVAGFSTLKRRFHEAQAGLTSQLVVAATPRILAEDLPECLDEFRRAHGDVRLSIKELWDEKLLSRVQAGEVDVGLVHNQGPEFARYEPWLELTPVYEVDIALITPPGHPLARRRHVRPADLRSYPIVNGLQFLPDLSVTAVLDQAGVLRSQPHLVEMTFTTTVCRYVQMGFGIGLIFVPPGRKAHPDLHERVMSRYFGRTTIYQVSRKGVPPFRSVTDFIDLVKERLRHV